MRPTSSLSRRAGFLLAALSVALAAPGCGGGGGGGGGGDPCEPPGSLVALALEGGVAPDTGGGAYGFFPTQTPIHMAEGGWTAFLADVVTGLGSTRALFVAPPTGPVRRVFRQGEAVPAPGDGTIDGFTRIFVTPQGVLVALVTIAGGTHTFGVVTARVDALGEVVEKAGAVFSGDVLPAAPGLLSPGALVAILPNLVHVSDSGVTFFVGIGGTGTGIYRVDRSGTPFAAVAQEGQAAVDAGTGETFGDEWQALGIDEDGVLVGFVAELVPSGGEAVYASNLTVMSLVAKSGDGPAGVGGRDLVDPYESGPLVVGLNGGVGILVWEGELEGADPNDVVLLRAVSPVQGPLQTMAAGGQVAPGGGAGATIGELRILDAQVDTFAVTVRAGVFGGATTEIFYNLPAAGTFNEIWRQGDDAPPPGPGAFTSTYPSLDVPLEIDADVGGSVALSAVFTDATTSVLWALRSCGFFDIARQGDDVPGVPGGDFGSFATPSSVTTATNAIAFRAAIDGVPGTASGVFRRR